VSQALPGYRFLGSGRQLADGSWIIDVDEEVAAFIQAERLPSERDDDVVSRLVRAAIGRRPN
jgi:hypothetical protein